MQNLGDKNKLKPLLARGLSRAKKTYIMKKICLLMIIGTAIISCTNDDEKGNSNHCDFKAIVSADQYKNASSDLLSVSSLEISSHCLKINISASGCDGNSWEVKLIDSEQIMESNPAQRNLRVTLKNDEVCTAYVGKTFTFDISELQIQDDDRVYLNIINSDDQILYEY